MNKKMIMRLLFAFCLLLLSIFPVSSQDNMVRFNLNDVILLAQKQSLDAILARNRFQASYWRHRSYAANYLPSLTLSAKTPEFSRSIVSYRDSEGVHYSENKGLDFSGGLKLNQNIGLTGGSVYMRSDLSREHQFLPDDTTRFNASPIISMGITQPIFAYNPLKWERKIEPIVFEEAKKNYLDALEQISLKAVSRFFDYASAQRNLNITKINYNNSDTLYKIAKGRYNLGTIAENDVLQMQLAFLNAKTSLTRAELDVEIQKQRLRSFLGYNEKVNFELLLPDSLPQMKIDYSKVLELSLQNNPDVLAWQRRSIEARRDVAQAKGERGFNTNLSLSYGLNNNAATLPSVYQKPKDNQLVSVGVDVPILDWGRGRGRVKMAKSNQELVNVQIQQEQMDFEQNIFLQVTQFNLQNDQVLIAAKADTIGQKRYDVTKQRFLIGKIDVLNLNDALKEKDSAKRGYVGALREYWNYFYTLRQLTLYDFIKDQPLSQEFDKLIE